MRKGSKGSDVLALQQSLNKLGKARGGTLAKTPLVEDGIFGALTDSAVRDFQKSAGLVVDGVVGYATLDALKKALTATGAAPKPDPSKIPTDADTLPATITESVKPKSGGVGTGTMLAVAGIAGLGFYMIRKKRQSA